MIEKISGIKISGKCFAPDTCFNFFKQNDKHARLTVVFGRNGSGKSSISCGFKKVSSQGTGDSINKLFSTKQQTVDQANIVASLIQEDGKQLENTSKIKIHVYDEDYINQNIKIQDVGLKTIVLLGAQGDLQEKIDKCKSEFEKNTKEEARLEEEYLTYKNPSNSRSPDCILKIIIDQLKGKWAKNDSELKDNIVKSKVTKEIVDEIGSMENKDNSSLKDLEAKYTKSKKEYDSLRNITFGFDQEIEKINLTKEHELEIIKALALKIPEPVLSDREKNILDAVRNNYQTMIENAKKTFEKSETQFCPYCFQEVTDVYKKSLVASINQVLNKAVEQHKQKLVSLLFHVDSRDYDSFSILNVDLVVEIKKKYDEIQRIMKAYNDLIEEKKGNIYVPIITGCLCLYEAQVNINRLIDKLNLERLKFNENLRTKANLKHKLLDLNKLITHEEINGLYKSYLIAKKEKEALEKNIDAIKIEGVEIKEKLDSLQSQKANIKIAVDKINWGLKYVFFKNDRLKLQNSNGNYSLLSNGKQVEPKAVSLGERNIIALCYFFIDILTNQEVDNLYKEEMLVVLDDPISSFDIENRVGIMSFLRYQIMSVLKGNSNSKILLMTHDLLTSCDLERAFKNLNTGFLSLELIEGVLKSSKGSLNEYRRLINKTFDFANSESTDDNAEMGNIMRRMFEAFSTFSYCLGPNEVISDPKIVNLLGDKSEYYGNLMFRILLNSESHFENQAKSISSDGSFVDFYSVKEKKNTAMDILSFMYTLNPLHLSAYLCDQKKIETVRKWSNAVTSNSLASHKKIKRK